MEQGSHALISISKRTTVRPRRVCTLAGAHHDAPSNPNGGNVTPNGPSSLTYFPLRSRSSSAPARSKCGSHNTCSTSASGWLMRLCSTNVGQSSIMSGAFLSGRIPPRHESVSTPQVTGPAPQDDIRANRGFPSRGASSRPTGSGTGGRDPLSARRERSGRRSDGAAPNGLVSHPSANSRPVKSYFGSQAPG